MSTSRALRCGMVDPTNLAKATEEDLRKLHTEVTQIMHQRFLVTTVAITTFALMAAWSINRFPPPPGQHPGALPFIASICLNVILGALAFLYYCLKAYARVLTTYLAESNGSAWEKDWKTYRKQ